MAVNVLQGTGFVCSESNKVKEMLMACLGGHTGRRKGFLHGLVLLHFHSSISRHIAVWGKLYTLCFGMLCSPVISCYLSSPLTIGSHCVTEMKINWGKIWNPSGFSCCCVSVSVGLTKHCQVWLCVFKEFPQGKLFWLSDNTNMLSLSLLSSHRVCGAVSWTEGITGQLQNHFLSAVKAALRPLKSGLTTRTVGGWGWSGSGPSYFLYLLKSLTVIASPLT